MSRKQHNRPLPFMEKAAALTKSRYALPALAAVLVLAALVAVLTAACGARGSETGSDSASDSASSESAASSAVSVAESEAESYEEVEADSEYDAEAAVIDTTVYSGTVLEKTKDAGDDYIDNTLFIGDSNCYRYMNYGFTALRNDIGMVGMGAAGITTEKKTKFKTLADCVTIPKAVSLMQPQRIIIGFGTNDLTGSCSTFISTYEKAIKKIYEAYPYCDIIVNAIPPVDKNRTYTNVTMQQIDKFNEALVKMCEENEWKFLNSSEALKDAATGFCKTSYTVADGLHLSKEGCTALFEYFRTHAYETKDRRPKPLKSIPERAETPAELITNDPLKSQNAGKTTKVDVTFTATEGGTITGTAEQSVKAGEACATVIAVPNAGYQFAGWSCTMGSISDVNSPALTFTVPSASEAYGGIFVTASFKKALFNVQFTAASGSFTAGGTVTAGLSAITPALSANVSAAAGEEARVVYKPVEGCRSVTASGGATAWANGDGTYTISLANVSASVSVTVTPVVPTATPVPAPTATATATPPTAAPPTAEPPAASEPTTAPTTAPSEPTAAPTEVPTMAPTTAPTTAPTDAPTTAPTTAPTEVPPPVEPAAPPADQTPAAASAEIA